MARLAPLVFALALGGGACASSGPGDDAAPPGAYDRRALVDALKGDLAAEGLVVDEGSFGIFHVEDCADLPSCFGNNPASPYGLAFVPPAPGEALVDLGAPFVKAGARAVWRMREDEAVVTILRTPPAARYLGVRSYVFSRAGETLFASLGDTLNELVLDTEGSATAFDAEAAVITTADRALDARLRALLAAHGVGGIANSDVVPPSVARLGLGAEADALTLLLRVALFDDGAAGDAWLAAPPALVLRVRPAAERPIDAFPAPALRTRGTGTTEAGQADALAALEQAARAAFADGLVDAVGVAPLDLRGWACLSGGTQCLGDNADALYTASLPIVLGSADRLVVLGVDHTRAGKATYTSLAAYDTTRQLGVGGTSDRDFGGSAAVYLAGDARADGLFAVSFARDCQGEAHCFTVGTAFPGVALDAPVSIAERAYLEPSTRTGPLGAELLRPRVLRVRPR